MSEVKDASDQEMIDISGEDIKHQAFIAKRIENRRQSMIELIMRQTDYGEIRNFMDDVNKQQLQRKRHAEKLEQQKAAYIAYMNKLQKEPKEIN
jgi:ribosomal 50S subunit-associated protein YjgA (DUF615 family)